MGPVRVRVVWLSAFGPDVGSQLCSLLCSDEVMDASDGYL